MSFKTSANTTGLLGESIFAKNMIDRGYLVYGLLNGFICPLCNDRCFGESTHHPFDFFCCRPSKRFQFDFQDCFLVEVKTKATDKWPNETGMNLADFQDYSQVQRQSPFPLWITIVKAEGIFTATLEELERERVIDEVSYPKKKVYHIKENNMIIEKHVVFFPLSSFKKVCNITDNQRAKLERTTSRQCTLEMPRVAA